MSARTACNNDLVIISTKEKMDAVDWSQYVLNHWHRLLGARGSKLLVLAGIHGNDTSKLREGGLGRRDEDYLEACQEQLDLIRRERHTDIEENDIEIMDVEDCSQHYLDAAEGDSNYRFNENREENNFMMPK